MMVRLLGCCVVAMLAATSCHAATPPPPPKAPAPKFKVGLVDDSGYGINHIHTTPVVLSDGDVIVVGGPHNDYVYRLDAGKNYAMMWRTDIDFYHYVKSAINTHVPTPVVDEKNGWVYAGSQHGNLHQLNLETGKHTVTLPFRSQGLTPNGGSVVGISSLTLANGALYFGSWATDTSQFNMHAYFPNGKLKWHRLEKHSSGSFTDVYAFQHQPVVADGVVYFVNSKRKGISVSYLWAVNEKDG